MLVLPRSVPIEISTQLEEQFLCSSIDEALSNVADWMLARTGAKDVVLCFERGFVGGKRSDQIQVIRTSRTDVPSDYATVLLQSLKDSDLLTRIGEEHRELLRPSTWVATDWPYGELNVTTPESESSLYHFPTDTTLCVPFSSDLIVVTGSERPFFGFYVLLFDGPIVLQNMFGNSLEALPELLSGVIANFIRERTSREEMLGFFAMNVQNHLLLTQALVNHMASDDAETRARLVAKMERTIKRMMIETDLVLLADRDAMENFKLETENVSLNEIVNEVTTELQPVFEMAKIRFRFHLDEKISQLPLDRKLFPSVIYNLLDNAFKFSRRFQSITLRTYESEGAVFLEVSDNGIGIPEDQWKVVFLKHYRASNNEEGGHGLGLYIVKRIVEAHRGEVFVTKRQGHKTTVVVKIPIQQASVRNQLQPDATPQA